jgi:hypothetical protein
MSNSAVVRAPKRIQLAYIATIAGALLGEFATAPPAYSGDLYGYGYGPNPYYQGVGYHNGCSPCGCSRCGCSSCGCWRCGCGGGCGCGVCGRGQVFERRVVEREYIERRYAAPCQSCEYGGSPWQAGPYGYGSSWQPGPYGYGGPRPTPFPYGSGGVRSISPAGYYDGSAE